MRSFTNRWTRSPPKLESLYAKRASTLAARGRPVAVWRQVCFGSGLLVIGFATLSPLGDRLERRWPFGFAAAFLALGLALRFDGFGLGDAAWFTVLAFWFFAIGWAASKSTTVWQRGTVTLVPAVGLVGYFGNPNRELLVFTGLALLIFGSGPVRGFAVVHCLGILTSIVSSVVVSRAIVNLAYGHRRKIAHLAIGDTGWK